MTARRIAVVGAGLAGLACAARLEQAGHQVSLFDKGRVPGGRMASRQLDGAVFDHGAQFATARGVAFQAALDGWRDAGVAEVWPAASAESSPRWVGVPTIATIPARVAGSLSRPPEQGRHVGALHRATDGWLVRHHLASEIAPGTVTRAGGELAGPFDAVVLALPGPQAAPLLAALGHRFAPLAAASRYAPCWTVLAIFPRRLDLADVLRPESGPLAWVAREASRPGRSADPERLVIQATGAWSREHLEAPDAEVRDGLLAALPGAANASAATASAATASAATAHRWRYAKVEQALGEACLWDRQIGLGVCGDWCLGGRLEAAWDSGQALSNAMLEG